LYKPENIATDMAAVIREFKPTSIFVTHPADTNPDHRAAANFVRLPCCDWRARDQGTGLLLRHSLW